MTGNETVRDTEKLDALYARLPKIACQRRCQGSCGPVLMSRMEWGRIVEARTRVGLPADGVVEGGLALVQTAADSWDCSMLSGNHCNVYAIRPLICRLWGLVDDPKMRCPWGCIPERWLSNAESRALLAEMERIGR